MKTKSTLKEKNANDFLTHTYKFAGITLISLVITIVILIILASVSIYLSLGNNGIFTRAKQAKEAMNKQTATEKINLKITTAQMNKYAQEQRMPTLKELSEVLAKDDEILYVTESSQVASTKYEVGDNPSSIFTRLNDYPYEFEINSSLQLASIDGVKTGNTGNNNNIYKLGTYEGKSVTVGTSSSLYNRMVSENTIEINVREKYSKYNKLTVNNFFAIDSLKLSRGYNVNGYNSSYAYSTIIKEYNQETGILTIVICFAAIDLAINSDDICQPGSTDIYIIENTNIPNL